MTIITKVNKDKACELLAQLTLDEKIGMIHGAGLFHTQGVSRLGIPALNMSDGPMGVRQELANDAWVAAYNSRDYVTYLPCGSAVASTWNMHLAHAMGQVLGAEARGRGKDVILGPSINIKRSPLCGRNFEYMSEDPCLTAGQCVPLIEGVQESDVAACVKHFVANNQETDRLLVDETISERALHELYLPAFQAAVTQAGALAVMGAYNLVNGERCCESTTFLDRILRDEWDFNGLTISDWSGVFRTKESAESGLDVEMSVTADFDDYKFANPLKSAVKNGEISERHINRKIYHILCVMDALHMLGQKEHGERRPGSYAITPHRDTALAVARESVVLLKNDDGLLPLPEYAMTRLLVVGANADHVHSNGGGSAEIKALYEVTPLLGLCGQLGGNVEVTYVPGYDTPQTQGQSADWQEKSLTDSTAPAVPDDCEHRMALRDEAVRLAREYEHVLFVGGLDHNYDLEGFDRTDMRLPYGQNELIDALLDANPNTIITLVAGSPVEMPWADRAKTIVWSWYGGCETGTALAEVLLGRVNPSGHLPESFPIHLQDSPAAMLGTFGLKGHVEYGEDIYVGYRYFETRRIPVRFCFGHGLSYTTFNFAELEVHRVDDTISVRCRVTNTGKVAGKTVMQVYMGLQGVDEDRPDKELKGYVKLALDPSESREVEIEVPVGIALRYYSNVSRRYELATQAVVYIGQSVQDIRLIGRVDR